MIVAKLIIGVDVGYGGVIFHNVQFDDLAQAEAEYARIADLIEKCESNANDLPTLLHVEGVSKVALPLDRVSSVSLQGLAKLEAGIAGMREAYPNLHKTVTGEKPAAQPSQGD